MEINNYSFLMSCCSQFELHRCFKLSGDRDKKHLVFSFYAHERWIRNENNK